MSPIFRKKDCIGLFFYSYELLHGILCGPAMGALCQPLYAFLSGAVVSGDCDTAAEPAAKNSAVCIGCHSDFALRCRPVIPGHISLDYNDRKGGDQRPEGYFVNRHVEYEPYAALCAAIDDGGYISVGLSMGADDYEYPLWRMLPDEVMRIEHVGVTNQSSGHADSSFQPDCIVWLGAEPGVPYVYNGKIYEQCKECGEGHYLLYPSP